VGGVSRTHNSVHWARADMGSMPPSQLEVDEPLAINHCGAMARERPLTESERLDWLRLIRSENVGPIGIR